MNKFKIGEVLKLEPHLVRIIKIKPYDSFFRQPRYIVRYLNKPLLGQTSGYVLDFFEDRAKRLTREEKLELL